MSTRIVKKVRKNNRFMDRFPPLNLASLLVVLICAFFIVIATFTPVPQLVLALPREALVNPSEFFAGANSVDRITSLFYYIPQIPVVIMIAAILGPRLGVLSAVIYIAAGLAGLPIFAGGGGLNYYQQQSFGYILGFIPGIYTAGNIMHGKLNLFSSFRAALVGVLAVHLIGILYLTGVLILKTQSLFAIFGWIWQLTGMQIGYDIIYSILAIVLGRLIRKIVWVATD